MSAPYTRDERRAAAARRDMQAIAQTVDVLRQLASYDGHLDARRGYVSTSLAALVESVGRAYRDVPPDVVAHVMAVVVAVDRATGQRRTS